MLAFRRTIRECLNSRDEHTRYNGLRLMRLLSDGFDDVTAFKQPAARPDPKHIAGTTAAATQARAALAKLLFEKDTADHVLHEVEPFRLWSVIRDQLRSRTTMWPFPKDISDALIAQGLQYAKEYTSSREVPLGDPISTAV